ncbi:toll-like receptor 2 [Ostrea edulis]|uniref:toll-like receptor 2 n=1 Tax=Ostrea edulis TaxID=37623 RepID=UPI0024AE8916|nr:toll-like receptor 2 [Ostrea edulis]
MITTQFTCCLIILFRISSLESNEEANCRRQPHTDECNNSRWLWNCSQLNLKRIPSFTTEKTEGRTFSIDLSRNKFTSISQTTFTGVKKGLLRNVTALYFRYNDLQIIESFSFKWLYKLCVLDVSYCKLHTASLRECAFSNLGKLEILYAQGNVFHKIRNKRKGYPDREITRLLSLKTLHIDVFEGFIFKSDFKRLKRLSDVEFYTTGSMFHLTNNTFSGLSDSPIHNLRMIFVYDVHCDVSEYLFCYFPYLKGVEMNFGGICGLSVVLRTLKCLQNRRIDYIHAIENVPYIVRQPFILNESNCEYLLSVCVKEVDFSSNRIAGISVEPHGSTMGKCIEHLNFSRNRIEVIDFSIVLNLMQNYPKLKYLDLSFNNIRCVADIADDSVQTHLNGTPTFTFTFSKELQTLLFSHNHIHVLSDSYKIYLNFVGEGLKVLNMSQTNFPFRILRQMNFPQLQILDISDNNCSDISFQLLQQTTKLEQFGASNTNMNLNAGLNMSKIFRGLKNLRQLDLRKLFIHKLPPSLLKDQTHLSGLYLENNYLSSIPSAVEPLLNLTHLYLQSNKISSLKPSDFHTLHNLKKVQIFIKGNPLNCDCLHISSLRWMKNNQHLFGDLHETECMEKSSTISKLFDEENFAEFEKKCQSQMWLLFSSSMLVLINALIIVSALIKRYRVHVDYIILRIRNRLKGIHLPKNKSFEFDAFISYAEDDYKLVTSTLYQALTNLGFEISLPDKDFIPGMSKVDQLIQSIDHSRKVVLVITENFLKSGWNSYAVQMAVTHAFHNNRKRSIIVIIKDNIPIERMPKDLQYIWWCILSIRWPDTLELMDGFWEDLATTLASV